MSQHGLSEHSHGQFVPLQIRSERPKSTSVSDFPEIDSRQDLWRYLSVEQLKGLDQDVLGEYQSEVSFESTDGIEVNWVDSTSKPVGSVGTPEDRVAAAAYTNASKTLLVRISGEIAEPFRIHVTGTSTKASALHIFVEALPHSRSTVILDYQGQGILGENVEILVSDEAHLNVVTVQNWAPDSVHVSAHFAKLGRNATLKHTVAAFGGSLLRVTPVTTFAAPGAEVEMNGVYFANSDQHIEMRPFVDHAAANCKSRVTYKGALSGEKAHTVWIGDVLIRVVAEGTDTYELNRNLLLTDGARADSVPNLEIETGEIVGAGHASASGRFDDEQLFYLQARGIDELSARQLVVMGFLLELLQKTNVPDVVERLTEVLQTKLGRK